MRVGDCSTKILSPKPLQGPLGVRVTGVSRDWVDVELCSEPPVNNSPFDTEFRLKKQDGSYMTVNATGTVTKNDDGIPFIMHGTIFDISALVENRMAYVPVPKDLTKVKTKVAFNLTKRQLVCFGCGALIGVPLFFLLRGPAGNSVAAMCMMLVMLPFFMLAMYEKHGQPLEKIIGNILKVAVIRPKQRPYRTNNFYAVLERQANLDKEVYDIVRGKDKAAGRTGTAADQTPA